jgi:ATP-dependent DNA ligase
VVFYAFDLLTVAGHDLRELPLSARKDLLARLAPRTGFIRFADHVEEDGVGLFAAAQQRGLEGIVAKRADSKYEAGRRTRSWLKLKVPHSRALVIAGALPGKGSPAAAAASGFTSATWARDFAPSSSQRSTPHSPLGAWSGRRSPAGLRLGREACASRGRSSCARSVSAR